MLGIVLDLFLNFLLNFEKKKELRALWIRRVVVAVVNSFEIGSETQKTKFYTKVKK